MNGTTSPTSTFREKVARILESKPQLANEIEKSCRVEGERKNWYPDIERVKNIMLKLARGHAAYECAETFRKEPNEILITPFLNLSAEERDAFEFQSPYAIWPEIGSRAFMRATGMIRSDPSDNGWQIVQPERYRYRVDYSDHPFTVKLVLSEYLSCQVAWH